MNKMKNLKSFLNNEVYPHSMWLAFKNNNKANISRQMIIFKKKLAFNMLKIKINKSLMFNMTLNNTLL